MRGLLIGRFQPFHLGHLATLADIRARRLDEPLLLGVGSAQASHTMENPFTAGERVEMIERAIAEAGVSQVEVYPIVDVDRHAVWVAHVESLVPRFDRVYTNNPLTRLLFQRAEYPVDAPELVNRAAYEGRRIRTDMVHGRPWKESVPRSVAAFIDELHGVERLRTLSERDRQRAGTSEG